MKLIVILITNNTTAYGEVNTLRQAVMFFWGPDRSATYDANGYVTGVN